MSVADRAPAVLFMGDMVVVARQERLITEARRRGLAPLLVVRSSLDRERLAARRADPDHPLSQVAEVIWVADERVETVLPAMRSALHRYDVQAVISTGEIFVEPVGVLADCLGLPGVGSMAARICRNKALQRMTVPELSPEWRLVPPGERSHVDAGELSYPLVVKPVNRYYSLGVRQVDRPADLAGVLAGYPEEDQVLVERRVEGPEFSVESFVQQGKVIWAQVTGKRTNEATGRYFTETGHTSPASLPADLNRVLIEANEMLLRRLRFGDGMTHTEFRLQSGVPMLMEVAARMPGDAITFLWELATGSAVEPVVLDIALGVRTSYPRPRRRACQMFPDHPFGKLADVTAGSTPVSWVERDDRWPAFTPVAADAPATRHAVIVGRTTGEMLGPMVDSTGRVVSVIFDVPLQETGEQFYRELADEVVISIE